MIYLVIAFAVVLLICSVAIYICGNFYAKIKELKKQAEEQKAAFTKLEEAYAKAKETKEKYNTGDTDTDFNNSIDVVSNLSGKRNKSKVVSDTSKSSK